MPRTSAALLVLAGLMTAGCGNSDDPSPTTTSPGGAVRLGPPFESRGELPGALRTRPPWPANVERLQQRLRRIGLPALTEEGQAVHIHEHLDLFVDGRKVTVPANIGIGASGAFLTSLHTHDNTGILHVESPTVTSFTLGQFFAVWGVRLDRNCIGALCSAAGRQLRAWVDGRPVAADPTRIVLDAHQEIVLAYGTPAQMPDPVPSTYRFPEGL